jgi:phospholipid/cholesterol/gamma-HCH transport system substrate-binding protein
VQSLILRPRSPWSRKRKPAPTESAQRRTDLRWGIIGIVALLVFAATAGVLSTVHFGKRTYTAELTDAGALRVGDEVRLAGITVGAVKSLELEPDHIAMTFTVDRKVFIGAQTTLDVRMLTIVCGHYVAVRPAGTSPLGNTPIPTDHVILPYSLPQAFQDAIVPVREIDGATLRANFGALTTAIDGSPESFRRILDATDSIVDILGRQNSEVSRTLQFTDEYLAALAQNKLVVGKLIDKFRLLETTIEDNKLTVGDSMQNLALVASQLAPLAREWNTTMKPMSQSLRDAIDGLDGLGAKLGALLESVRDLGNRLQALVTPDGTVAIDQSAATITAPALCIPVPGRTC